MHNPRESALDLSRCEQEPIHSPGAIQSASVLMMFNTNTAQLIAASDNLEPLFGAPAQDLLGAAPERFFCARDAAALRQTLGTPAPLNSGYYELANGDDHWVTLFLSDGLLGVEINTYEDAEHDSVAFGLGVGEALAEISEAADHTSSESDADIRHLADLVTRRFRDLSGYDRVMVYRFDTDWNGEVVGESRAPHLDRSYLGLSFPSSDIPRQARQLFKRNRVRPVVDVGAASVPLVPPVHPVTGQPFDLSDCSVRGVSPVHLEYLANMEVGASLTMALIVRGKLWGLLACHHSRGPYRLTPGRASACRLFAESVSSTLSRLVERSETETIEHVRQRLRAFRTALLQAPKTGGFGSFLSEQTQELLTLMHCDGMVYSLHGRDFSFGIVPAPLVLARLRERLQAHRVSTGRDTFSTHYAAGLWPDLAADLVDDAAGALLFQPRGCDFELLLLRRARTIELTWGGDPHKRITADADVDRLHPRRSFELWAETVRDRALPWAHEAAVAARELAMGLNEIDWLFEWHESEAELAAARAETEYNALHDALTDLPNRRYLQRKLEEAERAGTARPSALIHIDLDGFKQVNDTLGHSAGDQLLVEVARRIRHAVRAADFPARTGGDEFLILSGPDTHPWELDAMCDRLVQAVSRPVPLETGEAVVSASIGVALNTGDIDADTLFYQADIALYESKKTGRARVTLFNEALQRRQDEKLRLGEDIREGIGSGRFEIWYQPQFDATTFALCGVEALLRWNHPTQGIMLPAQFLEMAEDLDLSATLDGLGMQAALEDLATLEARGCRVPKLSLNISARRLEDPAFVAAVRALGPQRDVISFELLESIYLDEVDPRMEANLRALREMGIRIEVDDFGTGRTSIISLVSLRPDRLKIDRQLVEPIVRSEAARRLVASIVEIGHSLGIGITAEGVETREHAEILGAMGCTVLQGFHFARPMPLSALYDFLTTHEAKRA